MTVVAGIEVSPDHFIDGERVAGDKRFEVLSPIDRDVFERQVRYHSLIQAQPPDAGSGPNKDLFSGEKR